MTWSDLPGQSNGMRGVSMTCIQGFVAAVPTANLSAFIEHAKVAAESFRDHDLASQGCMVGRV
jgi:hypothetical protein